MKIIIKKNDDGFYMVRDVDRVTYHNSSNQYHREDGIAQIR